MRLDIQMFSSPYVAFEDLPSTDTPIDSTNLNKIQTDCRDEIGDLTLLETTDKSDLVSAINENKRNINEGGGIIALKTITTAPSTFDTGDKYYNSTDDLIYTAISSSTWNNGETPQFTIIYLNETDNKLYRYYDNTMNLVEPQILNTYSNSQTDTYSCNYVNSSFETKGTILWTNPNPTSSFPSQDITLSSSDYDVLEIFYKSSSGGSYCFSQKTLKGFSTSIINVAITQSPYVQRRYVDYVNDTKYNVKGMEGAYGGDNNNLVPIYVVGYKTGLFS